MIINRLALCFVFIAAYFQIDAHAVYVINLDRMPTRLDFMKNEFNKAGVAFHKVSAVDGYELKLKNRSTGEIISGKKSMRDIGKFTWEQRPAVYHVSYGGKYKDAEFDLFIKSRKITAGEIGVIYSHRAIWKDIVKKGYQNAIIFEDDVVLLKNFKQNLVDLMNNSPTDFDVVFITVGRRKDKSLFYPNIDNIFRDFDHVEGNNYVAKIQPTNLVYGMYAYIIGVKGAKKLLELTNCCEFALDDIVFQQGGVDKGSVKAYVAKQKMCFPKITDSEIKKMGRSY